jgi:hypothetical protein
MVTSQGIATQYYLPISIHYQVAVKLKITAGKAEQEVTMNLVCR